MNRILAGGDRLVLSIWTSIKDSPGFEKLRQLLQQIFGHEVATIMQMPYSLSDPLEVLSLVKNSGFDDVEMREVTKTASFRSIEEFIFSFTKGSMLAGYFSKVNEKEYKKLISYTKQELATFATEHSGSSTISFPLKCRLVFLEGVEGSHLERAPVICDQWIWDKLPF
jgi:hypothetical protein